MFAGTRSIQMLYRAVLFTFAPTFIELVFVITLLATQFSPMVALLVGGTFVLYVAWTLTMTQVMSSPQRSGLRRNQVLCMLRFCLGVWFSAFICFVQVVVFTSYSVQSHGGAAGWPNICTFVAWTLHNETG
eukprot:GHUV01038718.1.p1 GENE.GHUV01038718.1~~GHUV01038718.1.p1  ORF type:complete len:131 (-),score=8.42 GHUV01038718.1:57-449(-)